MVAESTSKKFNKLFVQKGHPVKKSVELAEVDPAFVLIKTHYSFVSLGTERQTLNAQATGILNRFLKKPEESFYKICAAIRERGVFGTLDLAKFTSEKMLSTGYSASGKVLYADPSTGFFPGQSVACAGAGFASHGELILCPKNLVVGLQDSNDLVNASASGVLAIALQAFHRAKIGLGQNVLVLGCGLLGNFLIQLAKLSGANVFGLDQDCEKEETSIKAGCKEFFLATSLETAAALKTFAEIDSIIVTVAISGSEVLDFCMSAARPGAKVVIVGDGNIEFSRENFYKKELSILASCSSGPGRNNQDYWTDKEDWPIEHVRWSARRNLALAADLLGSRKINLITHKKLNFQSQSFEQEYQASLNISGQPIVIDYGANEIRAENWSKNSEMALSPARRTREQFVSPPFKTAFVGIGAFSRGTLLSIVREQPDVRISAIVDTDHDALLTVGSMLGIEECHSTLEPILQDNSITVAIVATPHQFHARQTLALLERGLAVFVEKPLATTAQELDKIRDFVNKNSDAIVIVDFNRTQSKYAKFARDITARRLTPLVINYRVNALALSDSHWIWKSGGRVVGELCHMVEFLLSTIGSSPKSVSVSCVTGFEMLGKQNFFVTIGFSDGSVGTVCYTSLGNTGLSKENIEIFWEGRTLVIDDFCIVKGFGIDRSLPTGPDKGHCQIIKEFFRQVRELDYQENKKFLARAILASELCFIIDDLIAQGGGFSCVQ